MAYTLRLTNGKILLNLPDQQFDNVSTSLTLIGKNVNAYGTDINQNYIHILENFANNVSPREPLTGQLWYDTNSQQVKVYTARKEFKPVGAPIISPTKPITLSQGDLWFDSSSNQLKFQKDATNIVVIGPDFDASQGKSGWVTESYTRTIGGSATVVSMYSNDTLIGILSDENFRIADGTTSTNMRDIFVGLNLNIYDGAEPEFIGTATSAKSLTDSFGNIIPVDDVLTALNPIFTTGTIVINSDTAPLTLGSNNDFQFRVDRNFLETTATLYIAGQDENFAIRLNSLATSEPAFYIDGLNARVGLFTTRPTTSFEVNGDVAIRGDLFVLGTSTNVITQELRVIDKEIKLAWTTTAISTETLLASSGAGIEIQNFPYSREFKWYFTEPSTFSQNVWSLTDDLELRFSTATYRIAGNPVLSIDSLGNSVRFARGIEEVGVLTSATIAGIKVNSSSTYSTLTNYTTVVSGDNPNTIIVIGDPSNTLHIEFAGKKIFNVDSPQAADPASTVATKGYVQDQVDYSRNLRTSLQLDVTGFGVTPEAPTIDAWVIQSLTRMLPPMPEPPAPTTDPEYPYYSPENTRIRVMIVRYTTPPLTNIASEYLDPGVPLFVDKEGVQNSAEVIQWSQFLRVVTNFPASDLGINRAIKQYIVSGGIWVADPGGGAANLIWTDGSW
jgi:hypothetical protein